MKRKKYLLAVLLLVLLVGCSFDKSKESLDWNESEDTSKEEVQWERGGVLLQKEKNVEEKEIKIQGGPVDLRRCGKWYNEKLPYDEIELYSDGTYVSTLFGRGTYQMGENAVVLFCKDKEYAFSFGRDSQKLTYDDMRYIRKQYPIPETVTEYGREWSCIYISQDEYEHAKIVSLNAEGEEISSRGIGEEFLTFGAVIQDLNTYPWYDGDDVLIFGGFYADNGFVSSVTLKYIPFKIVSIRFASIEEQNEICKYEYDIDVKTEDEVIHNMHMTVREDSRDEVYGSQRTLSSDLFDGHVFQMNNNVNYSEPIIWGGE